MTFSKFRLKGCPERFKKVNGVEINQQMFCEDTEAVCGTVTGHETSLSPGE
jgi:hypothetical protein